MKKILVFATQGSGGNEEHRIRTLFGRFEIEIFPFLRSAKVTSARLLIKRILELKPSLVVMEGSGSAGGLSLILCHIFLGTQFVVSSGDAIAPFLGARYPLLRWVFTFYEHLLYRLSCGFIGWTPYLTGRALTMGAQRAMTAPGWAPYKISPAERPALRKQIRTELGIPSDAIVIGIAGSIIWNPRPRYCYGMELVGAMQYSQKKEFFVLIVGDGTGVSHMKKRIVDKQIPRERILFTGQVSQAQVIHYLAAMDVASLPQSCDTVGHFRFTTKLPEYLAASLPIALGEIPMAYDLQEKNWLHRIGGNAPWEERYERNLAAFLDHLTPEQIASSEPPATVAELWFNQQSQVLRVEQFVKDLIK